MARPRIYETDEELHEACESYFTSCAENKEKATTTGLALYLGFCERKSLYDYADRPEFLHTIKKALLMVENGYEQNLFTNNVTGSIFALKNMGWKDKSEVEQSGTITKQIVYEPQPGNEPIKD